MPKYFAIMRDGSDDTTYYDAYNDEDAVRLAEQWVRGGEWDYEDNSTTWFDYSVHRLPVNQTLHNDDAWSWDADKYMVKKDTVTMHPLEPACSSACDHNWISTVEIEGGMPANPGVFIHGYGVLVLLHCAHCNITKTVDTNAQRADTDEKGLQAISYGKLDDELYV